MDNVATDGGNWSDDTEVSHRGAKVYVVHRDVCGGPTDDRGVAAGVAAYLLVVRLRGCAAG